MAIKMQQRLCRILGGAALVVVGGIGIWRYDADVVGGWGRRRGAS